MKHISLNEVFSQKSQLLKTILRRLSAEIMELMRTSQVGRCRPGPLASLGVGTAMGSLGIRSL